MTGGPFTSARARAKPETHRRTVDMGGLSQPVRVLVWVGYASVAALLVATLASKGLSALSSTVSVRSADGDVTIPSAIAFVAGIALVVGWAFVLTGAAYFRKGLFFPVVAVFLLVVVMQGSLGRWLLLIAIGGLALWVHYARGHITPWERLPLIEFGLWCIGGAILFAPVLLGSGDLQSAEGLEASLELILIIAIPFWLLLGAEVCELAVAAGRWVVTATQRRFDGHHRLLAWTILLAPPIVSLSLLGSSRWAGMSVDLLLGLVLIAIAAALVLARRWTARAGLMLQVVSVALLVLAWVVSLGFGGPLDEAQDPIEWALAWTPLPAVFLFVLALTFNVLSFGARYCNGDSALMPRGGRVLAYFGFAILVGGALLLLANARSADGNPPDLAKTLTSGIAGLGVLFVAFPYLGWLLVRRRDRLAP